MIFYDDNEFDSKKKFENKYGKLTNPKDIILDVTIKSENNKGEKKNEEINKTMLKKRKRHDSSDEEEDKDENKIRKKKEKKEEKEEFINKINNVNEILDENNEEKNKKEDKESKEVKDTWKKGFIDIEELNKKIEVKESAKILDDPMKNLLSKNKLIEETDELIKKRGFYLPRCKFAPLINRFNIKPGYRWDGFNRSNGFENKIMNLKFNINN